MLWLNEGSTIYLTLVLLRYRTLLVRLGGLIIDIYQHFRPEEHELIDRLIDKCDQAAQQYAPVLTNFLDPRETTYTISDSGKL